VVTEETIKDAREPRAEQAGTARPDASGRHRLTIRDWSYRAPATRDSPGAPPGTAGGCPTLPIRSAGMPGPPCERRPEHPICTRSTTATYLLNGAHNGGYARQVRQDIRHRATGCLRVGR
jgi:hypothetical protein